MTKFFGLSSSHAAWTASGWKRERKDSERSTENDIITGIGYRTQFGSRDCIYFLLCLSIPIASLWLQELIVMLMQCLLQWLEKKSLESWEGFSLEFAWYTRISWFKECVLHNLARIEKRFQSISLLSYSLRFFFRRIYFLFHSLSFLVLKTFWGIRFSARLPVLILRIKKLRWNFCLLFRLFFPKRRFALNLSLCLLKWSCLLFLFLLHFLPQEERRWLTTMIVILLMSKQRPGIHKECHSLFPKMQERDWYYRLNGWVGIWWGWGMKETEKAKEKRRWREKELWCKMRFNKHCLSVLRWWWCFSCSSI